MTRTVHARIARTSGRLAVGALAAATALGGALVAGAEPASAGSATSEYGTLSVPDSVLAARHTCATYTYSYAMTPPEGLWLLETFVVDPAGVTVASGAILGDYTPGGDQASSSFQLCRNTTTPGTFTLRGTFSVDDGTGRITTSAMSPATFVLSKPARSGKAGSAQKTKAQRAAQRAAQKRAQQKAQQRKERRQEQRRRDQRS